MFPGRIGFAYGTDTPGDRAADRLEDGALRDDGAKTERAPGVSWLGPHLLPVLQPMVEAADWEQGYARCGFV